MNTPQQYSAMVGVPFTADDVLKTGERIYNLERYYNNLAGIRRRQRLPAEALHRRSLHHAWLQGARLRAGPDAG